MYVPTDLRCAGSTPVDATGNGADEAAMAGSRAHGGGSEVQRSRKSEKMDPRCRVEAVSLLCGSGHAVTGR